MRVVPALNSKPAGVPDFRQGVWELSGVGSSEASLLGEIMQRLLNIGMGIVFSFAVVLGPGNAYGQGGATGAISGTVLDSGGGSVAGADVQIINTATDTVTRKVATGMPMASAAALAFARDTARMALAPSLDLVSVPSSSSMIRSTVS